MVDDLVRFALVVGTGRERCGQRRDNHDHHDEDHKDRQQAFVASGPADRSQRGAAAAPAILAGTSGDAHIPPPCLLAPVIRSPPLAVTARHL